MTNATNSLKSALFAATALLLPLAASTASAQEACGESTCDKGYTCEEGPGICPLVLCEEGGDCPPCEPETIEYCVPAECDSDADCADYMTCHGFDTQDCPEVTPECAESHTDAECTAMWEAWQAECQDVEVHQCAPRWSLECEVASDCGEGFECIHYEVCPDCRGDASKDEEVVCGGCTTSDTGYCQAIEQACDDDSDCLENWVCGENYNSNCEDDGTGNFICEPADPAKICYPKEPGGGYPGVISLATDPAVLEDGPAPSPAVQSGAAPASVASDADSQEDLSLPTDEATAAPQMAESNGGLEEDGMGPSSSSGGGCSVQSTPSKGGSELPMLLLGLGLAASSLRRRKH